MVLLSYFTAFNLNYQGEYDYVALLQLLHQASRSWLCACCCRFDYPTYA